MLVGTPNKRFPSTQSTPLRQQSRPSFGGFLSPVVGSTPGRIGTSSSEDRKRSFEEWLKIAADNKINGQNTWNLALIDYFADMTLLREGDSINFQKASYTLDGCVKVYTSRIDSVDSETKNLLIGLVDKEEVEVEQNAKTLVDNSVLSMDAFELEFVADPLFQKTAADFDEGGAKGLLFNHLDISTDGKIVFDATDSHTTIPIEDGQFDIDLTDLKEKFESAFHNIWNMEICPTFSTFQFNEEDGQEFDFHKNRENYYADQFEDISDVDEPIQMDHPNYDQPDFTSDVGEVFDQEQQQLEMSGLNPNMSIISESNRIMNITQMVEYTQVKSDDNIFAYFDKIPARNWAGPEFWKSRAIRVPVAAKPGKTPAKRKPKTNLNFIDVDPIDPKVLFAKSSTSTLLPKYSSKSEETFLLPPDLKFNGERMTRLFLKPETKYHQFGNKQQKSASRTVSTPSHSIANNQESHIPDEIPEGFMLAGFDINEDDDEAEPFENDIGGFQQDFYDNPTSEQGDLTTKDMKDLEYGDQLVGEPIRVKAKPLMFAKTAKRVDVQKLKENLWQKLSEDSSEQETAMTEPVAFSHIVQELDSVYPEKQRKDISVAFCFICVLHLANENNLSIAGESSLKELTISFN